MYYLAILFPDLADNITLNLVNVKEDNTNKLDSVSLMKLFPVFWFLFFKARWLTKWSSVAFFLKLDLPIISFPLKKISEFVYNFHKPLKIVEKDQLIIFIASTSSSSTWAAFTGSLSFHTAYLVIFTKALFWCSNFIVYIIHNPNFQLLIKYFSVHILWPS